MEGTDLRDLCIVRPIRTAYARSQIQPARPERTTAKPGVGSSHPARAARSSRSTRQFGGWRDRGKRSKTGGDRKHRKRSKTASFLPVCGTRPFNNGRWLVGVSNFCALRALAGGGQKRPIFQAISRRLLSGGDRAEVRAQAAAAHGNSALPSRCTAVLVNLDSGWLESADAEWNTMKFEISGVDQQGEDRTIVVAGPDERMALDKAKAAGIFASSVRTVHEGGPERVPPPLPLEQTPGSDKEFSGPYRYKMVQIPPNISVKEGAKTDQHAAEYLQNVVNRYAGEGWEYYRVDEIGIHVQPGCLAALFGSGPSRQTYYVITFRKAPKQEPPSV